MINSVSLWWIRTTSLCCVITNNITHPVQAHLCQNIQQVWKVNLIYLFLFPNTNILLTLVTSGDYIIRSLWVTRGNVCKQSVLCFSLPARVDCNEVLIISHLYSFSAHYPVLIRSVHWLCLTKHYWVVRPKGLFLALWGTFQIVCNSPVLDNPYNP